MKKYEIMGFCNISWILFAILFIRYMIQCHNSTISIIAGILGFVIIPFVIKDELDG